MFGSLSTVQKGLIFNFQLIFTRLAYSLLKKLYLLKLYLLKKLIKQLTIVYPTPPSNIKISFVL